MRICFHCAAELVGPSGLECLSFISGKSFHIVPLIIFLFVFLNWVFKVKIFFFLISHFILFLFFSFTLFHFTTLYWFCHTLT